jgi:hypothetical protein
MSENQKKVLEMLAAGKISIDEATTLLALVNEGRNSGNEGAETPKGTKSLPKFLYVRVEPKEGRPAHVEGHYSAGEHGRVNVRIPIGLIRAGMKLKSLIPPHVADEVNDAMKEKGIGFDIRSLKDEDIDELINLLRETEINVDSEDAEIRVYAE